MDANHHLHKPVMIGEIKADGQFSVVWKTKTAVRAQPWSPFIPGNENKPDHLAWMNPEIDAFTAADIGR
jgi:urea transport system substrate-binding protein